MSCTIDYWGFVRSLTGIPIVAWMIIPKTKKTCFDGRYGFICKKHLNLNACGSSNGNCDFMRNHWVLSH